jgi:glycosyltransferase involved in cell wall biosynthesis
MAVHLMGTPRFGLAAPCRQATIRALLVGHTYILRVNQQKLEPIRRRCEAVGLLVPENWVDRTGLYGCRRMSVQQPDTSIQMYMARALRPGHVASYVFDPVALVAALKDFRPNVVQVDQEVYSTASAQVVLTARALGIKSVVFGWENLHRRIHPIQRVARRAVLALTDAILCGNTEGSALVRRWGYRRRIEVIPQMGVDTQFFPRITSRPKAEFTLGYVGRLVPEKGVATLLKAVLLLERSGHAFRAVVYGSGTASGELMRLAADLGISRRISWMGPVSHERVPAAMSEIDALVLPSNTTPSWKEQFGHVLIEAMSMGIPVVGSSSGAIPEVIGREDVIFPEGDAIALASRLRRLLDDKAWRQELSDHGASRVRSRYTHDRIAERLVAVWSDIVGQGGSDRADGVQVDNPALA